MMTVQTSNQYVAFAEGKRLTLIDIPVWSCVPGSQVRDLTKGSKRKARRWVQGTGWIKSNGVAWGWLAAKKVDANSSDQPQLTPVDIKQLEDTIM
jgi:hypothetical protein